VTFPNTGAALVLTLSFGGRPEPSADPLRQLDDDPLRAADVAEPIDVFVALHLANEFPAVGSPSNEGSNPSPRDLVHRINRKHGGDRERWSRAVSLY
jgi:hypothetical protein